VSKRLEKAKREAERRGVGGYQRHIFLCIGPDCCSPKEGDEAWSHLKKRVAQLNGSPECGSVYRTKVGCLRICHEGPVAVVYPEGTWYGGLDRHGLDQVIDEHLAHGRPVEDLAIGSNPLPPPAPDRESPLTD
jgi:(2Fe-2S) ferredoxin